MPRLSLTSPWIAILAICLPRPLTVLGQKPVSPPLAPATMRSCVLSDQETIFAYLPTDMGVANWQVEWSLMAEHRTLGRGSSQALTAPVTAPEFDVPRYEIKIPMPPLRDSVVLPVQLHLTWRAEEKTYHHNRPLSIFSSNPFATQRAFLEAAQIKLFDTDGMTAELLDAYEIPHLRLLNLSAIDLVTEGIVLVGEGVSFREERKLAETLLRVAQRGVPVLCLAPSEGDILLATPPQADKLMRPSRLVLERGEVVRRYDKRFDQIPTVCHLSLAPRRNEVVLGAASGQEGWSWLDLEFPPVASEKSPGRLIVCGLGLVTHWDASPVPRYLLVHLLKELAQSTLSSPLEEQENVDP